MKKRYYFLLTGILIGGFTAASTCTRYSCKALIYSFWVETFEDCVEAGFPVIAGDPPRCYLSEEQVFLSPPQHVRVTAPKPNAVVGKDFLLEGEARAIGNQVSYVLKDENKQTLANGTVSLASQDHGRFGDFSRTITLNPIPEGQGILEVFEQLSVGEKESVVTIPLLFSPAADSVETADELLGISNETTARLDESSVIREFDPLSNADETFPREVTLNVPFVPQAPFADWDPPYDEACEEAALIMVKYFLTGDSLSFDAANDEIVLLIDWERKHGYSIDITAAKTAEVAKSYYDFKAKVYTGESVTKENIKRLIAAGYPVVIPAAGQLLGNPYFRGAGPPYHMLVITGYDDKTFRTNDPGTKRGKDFEYSQDKIMNAIHDWNDTKEKILQGQRAMLVLGI